MTRAPVWVPSPAHAGVLGELAGTVEGVSRPSGAICVVDGDDGWAERAVELTREGAVALVIADPAPVWVTQIDGLLSTGTPVVLDRPRLPPDLLAGPSTASRAHVFLAEAVSLPAERLAVAQDALGWVRLLAGVELRIDRTAHTALATIAMARTMSGVPVSLSITQAADGARPAMNVLAVGPERTEVRIDDATLERRIRVADADGVREPRPRWETGLRLAVRRAVASLSGEPVTELDDLRHDAAAAAAVLGVTANA
jgi:hypothetical protein